MRKLFILLVVLAGFGVSSFAQSFATADASAILVAPLAIAKAVGGDFNFGTLAATGTTGTASLTAAGVLSTSPEVKLISNSGKSNAKFDVTGEPSKVITVTLATVPAAAAELAEPGGAKLTLDGLVHDQAATPSLSGTGTLTLTLGATLHIPANSIAGTYTSTGGVKVTVNYN